MRITSVRIQNYRAHSDTLIPISQFGCLIGENNAGKSSVLHAIQFVLEEKKLNVSDFRETGKPVAVTVQIQDIDRQDLERVSSIHRERVTSMVRSGTLTIIRTQDAGASAESRYLSFEPSGAHWSDEGLRGAVTGKKGVALREAAIAFEPKFDEILTETPKMADVNDSWELIKSRLPSEELIEVPTKFATGISAGLRPLLPSVIYIEAVKDATAEVKATGTATFSKLLELLFAEVNGQLENIEKEFASVHARLSRVFLEDGTESDGRLPAVQLIEKTIERFIQSSFPDVKLKMDVPAPTLSTILSGAELAIDDGHEGLLASKGDGLKRTVLFAILRAYTELRGRGLSQEPAATSNQHSYILLFEEPELYLHPRAQRQLMAALEIFSQDHQVLVTTHSPGFFTPTTNGFAKLQKTSSGVQAYAVSLEMQTRDAYQLVQHENNEAAFFARVVVLVEGDSDTITFPHLAKVITDQWDQHDQNVMFIKTGGKGSIRRYRDFFQQFDVRVHVITDLDSLVEGFPQLTTDPSLLREHSELMSKVGEQLPTTSSPNSRKVKEIIERQHSKDLWLSAQTFLADWIATPDAATAQKLQATLEDLFDQGRKASKEAVLADPPTLEIESRRDALIANLAQRQIYVLKRGDLEVYCGGSASSDKVAESIAFCSETVTLADYARRTGEDALSMISELSEVYAAIYGVPRGATSSI